MSENPLLSFQLVTFTYPGSKQAALNHFSLEIGAGSVTAILGPNGAGKTTLLHLVLGWLRPQAGDILLDGRPQSGYARREMGRLVGLVPQTENVSFDFSLLDYVSLGRAPYLAPLAMPGEEDLRIAWQALEQVGMAALANRSVLSLSGGERQLVLIARALAQQPRLLLLDEPTSHLDLSNKGRLVAVLRQLVRDGVTVMLTTHEPDVAAAVATHLVLVKAGQVFSAGTFEEGFTTQALTGVYGRPVEVAKVGERQVVLWS
jgi:iron complex transport system ATP-binding protein